jgi:hypothetical protein
LKILANAMKLEQGAPFLTGAFANGEVFTAGFRVSASQWCAGRRYTGNSVALGNGVNGFGGGRGIGSYRRVEEHDREK